MMDSTHPADADDSEVVTTATGPTMRDRFRGFLPVVVDIETGGFNCQTDAILEIAMNLLKMGEDGQLEIAETHSRNVCLLYTSPSPRDRQKSRMPSSA